MNVPNNMVTLRNIFLFNSHLHLQWSCHQIVIIELCRNAAVHENTTLAFSHQLKESGAVQGHVVALLLLSVGR